MLLPGMRELATRSQNYRGGATQKAKTAADLHCVRCRISVALHWDEVASKDLHIAVHKRGSAPKYEDAWIEPKEKLNSTEE